MRRYAPALLTAFDFEAAPSAEPLIEAVGVLKEMNEKGRRKVSGALRGCSGDGCREAEGP